jgi:hypothetical protein
MTYSSDIVGALVILVTALLAERATEKWKKWAWALFVVLVMAQAGIQIYQKRAEHLKVDADKREKQSELRESKTTAITMLSTLQNTQNVLSLVMSEVQSVKTDLKTFGQSQTDHQSVSTIENLRRRAEVAEQATRQLSAFLTEQSKAANWPFGAAGSNYPGLHEFFMRNFREANDLNGLDRFYLYQLMKTGGEIGRTGEDALPEIFKKEFGLSGSSGWSVYSKLENLGFIEEVTSRGAVTGFRLKEPYYSRFKRVMIP